MRRLVYIFLILIVNGLISPENQMQQPKVNQQIYKLKLSLRTIISRKPI